jgi:hypothetical protein
MSNNNFLALHFGEKKILKTSINILRVKADFTSKSAEAGSL